MGCREVGPGAGDNAAAALGVAAGPGDVIISIGTSGVVSAVADFPIADSNGEVINFADATGRFLRLATTPIAARVLDATARMLGVEHREFSRLALSVPAGSDGLVLLPYFEKASGLAQLRARGLVHGLAEANATPAHLARAAVEGILCSLAESLDALMHSGARPERLLLVGGAARSEAVRQIAPMVFGQPVVILSSLVRGMGCGTTSGLDVDVRPRTATLANHSTRPLRRSRSISASTFCGGAEPLSRST